MTVDAKLTLIAPELDSLTQQERDDTIALSELQVGADFCGGGELRELAVAYLTAHSLTLRARAGNAGAVGSVSEGDLSITYRSAGGATGLEGLSTTSYGQEYERLKRQCVIGARNRTI